MNKELIQKLFGESCWDEQAEVDIEDFISVEKFAKLIIDECLNQCYNRGMNDELYEGQLRAAEYIEQHFGVEE
jgi:hypothetical protein